MALLFKVLDLTDHACRDRHQHLRNSISELKNLGCYGQQVYNCVIK